MAQYPAGMGMKKSATSNALAVQTDAEGKVKYDAIARYGHAKDKVRGLKFHLTPNLLDYTFHSGSEIQMGLTQNCLLCMPQVIHSKFQDLVPKTMQDDDPELEKPDEETIKETTEKTREALEKLVQSKISAAMPVRHAEKQAPTQYIR